eukprot:gene16646-18336_t
MSSESETASDLSKDIIGQVSSTYLEDEDDALKEAMALSLSEEPIESTSAENCDDTAVSDASAKDSSEETLIKSSSLSEDLVQCAGENCDAEVRVDIRKETVGDRVESSQDADEVRMEIGDGVGSGMEMEGVKDSKMETEGVKDSSMETEGVKDSRMETKGVKDSKMETEGVKDSKMETEGVKDSRMETKGVKDSKMETEGVKDSIMETEGVKEDTQMEVNICDFGNKTEIPVADDGNAGVNPVSLTEESSIEKPQSGGAASIEKTATCQTSPVSVASRDVQQSFYYLKKLKFNGEHIQIVTQNENGPCPLLAIANVLALSKRIVLPSVQQCITASQLMEYIGDYILTVAPQNADEQFLLNYQQNMHDAISIMHKLQTGIDVNVKFTGPRDFEFTSECLVFDLLNIGLYHGWLVDPQDFRTVTAIGSLSYNQLVEKIIKSKESNVTEETVSQGLLTEAFLEGTASQLTYHGLCELNSAVNEEELAVFFRNNHFSTLYKHRGELFLLVTDQGYLDESRIIWETLANVDGAGQFVDESFHTVGPMSYQPPSNAETAKSATSSQPAISHQLSQEDRDYLIALSLGEDAQHNTTRTPQQQEAHDLALAQRLQSEENEFAARQQQQQQQQNHPQQQQPQSRHTYAQDNTYRQRQQQPTRGEVGGRGRSSDDRNADKCTIL